MSDKNSGTQGISLIIGKTIKSERQLCIKEKGSDTIMDDSPYLLIQFTDGTQVVFVSQYGGYSGNSIGKYPAYIEYVTYSDFLKHWDYYYAEDYELV